MFQSNTLVGKTTGMVQFAINSEEGGKVLRFKLFMPFGQAHDKEINGETRKVRENMFVPVVAFGQNAEKLFEAFGPVDGKPSPRRVAIMGEWRPVVMQEGKQPKLIEITVPVNGTNVKVKLSAAALAQKLAKDFYYTSWEFHVIYWRYADDAPEGTFTGTATGDGLVATISVEGDVEGAEVDPNAVVADGTGETFQADPTLDDAPF